MQDTLSNNPLHGITIMLEQLVVYYGFAALSKIIRIKCFTDNPTIKSSLTFLRKTEWARTKVEELYLKTLSKFPNG